MKGQTRTMVIFGVACSCLAVLIQLAACEEDPVISYISEEKIKEIDEEVEFNCTVQDTKDYPVLWIKLDKDRLDHVSLSTNATPIIRDPRFSVRFDNVTSTYSLKIKALQEADTGFYECQILLDVNNKVFAEVELQIRRPPTIGGNTTKLANATEGGPVELYCSADGFPVPRISWKRENDVLLSTGRSVFHGNVLRLPSVGRGDRGVYHCIAENGVGREARANATVLVEFGPVVTAVRPRVGQAQGYTGQLECRIEAHPAPKLVWLRDGRELEQADPEADLARRDEGDEEGGLGDVYVGTYRRYSIDAGDYGQYVCRAENKLGRAEARVELFETIVPSCANSCG